jgi:hypothetical protein
MEIPSYQIRNVLKVYSRQVSQGRGLTRKASAAPVDKIAISAEGKREAVIDKVVEEIVGRITRFGGDDDGSKIKERLHEEITSGKEGADFVFNILDGENGKTTRTLSMEDSDFVIRRLEELAGSITGEKAGAEEGDDV